MSISRQFLRELRPFFRMFDETLSRPTNFSGFPATYQHFLNDPFFRGLSQPAIDLTEDGNKYIIEAELPGVKKENLSLSIGENGRSLTIEGRVVETSTPEPQGTASASSTSEVSTPADQGSQAVVPNQQNQLTSERSFVRNSSFSRTVWLPRAVEGKAVDAKLADGILTVKLQKAEDKARVEIPIE